MFNIVTYCICGSKESILKVYLTFEKLVNKGIVSSTNPMMENMVKAFGKSTEDYPYRCEYKNMYIRDYDQESFVRLYFEIWEHASYSTELVELLIETAGVSDKVKVVYCVELGEDHVSHTLSEAEKALFVEPDDDALMSTINSYWMEEHSACEIAEGYFDKEFSSIEDLEQFLAMH